MLECVVYLPIKQPQKKFRVAKPNLILPLSCIRGDQQTGCASGVHLTYYGSKFDSMPTNLMFTLMCVLASAYIFCTRDASSRGLTAF